ncbi:amidase [Bordetella sp. 02P26C-1]|uniref:amidase n=1 Tax=Bordetella sp. 02P26C-1 TaxID=2683195 RepID=UPI0013531D68|nr:amidase [Bordetella sp. 02P26C-1]MVW78131.1 amidase [Bordetella sp. 02P26C-1]
MSPTPAVRAHDEPQNAFKETAAQFVAAATTELHGIRSRTEPEDLAAELDRLNSAVRASAGSISPYAQPADFLQSLLQQQDTSNEAVAVATRTHVPAGEPMSLAEAARRMASGELSAVQLTEQALARATECQPTLNAFIEIWADKALAQAHAADAERARGELRGPLHGIPLAHKDCFEIQGHAATIGSRARPAVPATTDAHAIQCLNQAGAITLGVLNLNEMVAGPTGQNPAFGDCCNALDPSRISGGSSSGSGAAVASGAVFGSLGSDTGGSIRLPASVHGLYGLKPTYGRISRAGCFPRAFSLDCPGPLARTAEDCAIVLEAVAGWDAKDPSTLPAPVPAYSALLDSAAEKSRIAVIGLSEADACHPEIAAVFTDFVQRAERSFGSVREVSFPQLAACYAMGDIISKVEAATLHGQWMRSSPDAYSQAVYSRTEPGLHVSAVRYLESLLVRARVLEEFLAGPMADHDILLCPSVPIPVPLRSEADMEKKGSVFGVVPQITRLTRPFSYLGVPVLSIPIGLDRNGMPVGAQVIGRPLSEARLLAFAHQMSRA